MSIERRAAAGWSRRGTVGLVLLVLGGCGGGEAAPGGGAGGGGGESPAGGGDVPAPTDVAPFVAHELTAARCTPSGSATTFVEAIAPSAWVDIELAPAGGMAALAAELGRLRTEDRDRPVRLRLAPGAYAATDVGRGELYIKNLARKASAPVLVQAVDPAPNATRLAQGFNLVNAAYVAFDGVTIGPAAVGAFQKKGPCEVTGNCSHADPKPLAAEAGFHVSGTAIDPRRSGLANGHLDYTVYGRYLPSHHIVLRRVTIQNLFGADEPSGRDAEGPGSDGIKFNQAADVWVVDSRIRQVSRHGIDNVGVHGACFFGNTIAETGLGLGAEAKGGSVDVTYDGNVFVDVRRFELGGENTDATYYWSAETPGDPEHYAYEARRMIARNNLIVDGREGGLEVSGCHDCAAVNNTIFFRGSFDGRAGGGDAVREVDSMINRDGAGADCSPADGDGVETCWGVGAYPKDLVAKPGKTGASRALGNARNALANNLFVSVSGLWGPALNPYNHPNAGHSFGFSVVDYNYWANGGKPMPDPGDGSWLREGAHSVYTGAAAHADPALTGALADMDATSPSLGAAVRAALRPRAGSPLVGKASVVAPGAPSHDANGLARPALPAIGALEPAP